MSNSYDYLIALSVGTSKEPKGKPMTKQIFDILQEDNETLEQVGQIIEMNWCVYDIKSQLGVKDSQVFIHYDDLVLNQQTLETNNYSQQTIQKINKESRKFTEALDQLNDYTYQTIVKNNKSFCLVIFGDGILTSVLPKNAQKFQVKLPLHYHQYFDIATEFKKFIPHAIQLQTLADMLKYTNLNLKDDNTETLSQSECKSILRLINMLTRQGHVFNFPKMTNNQHQIIMENMDVKTRYIADRQVRSKKNYIRNRSPSPFKNPTRGYYIRLRGLQYNAKEYEVFEFLRGVRVCKEDIAFQYDSEGKFTGEVYVRLLSESDKQEALSWNLGIMEKRFIEIFETNENEFTNAKMSQFADKRDARISEDEGKDFDNIIKDGAGIVRIKGLPYNCTEEDIRRFFKGLTIVNGGIKRAILGGKPGGECFVIFSNKEDAHKALNWHMEKMGKRFIEVFLASYKEFQNYMAHNFVNSHAHYSKDNMPNIPQEQRKSTLMIMGLPFQVTKAQITEFFSGFEVHERQIYLLSSHSGKFSGNALVSFEDELESQRALKMKNFSYLGNRYLELFEYK